MSKGDAFTGDDELSALRLADTDALSGLDTSAAIQVPAADAFAASSASLISATAADSDNATASDNSSLGVTGADTLTGADLEQSRWPADTDSGSGLEASAERPEGADTAVAADASSLTAGPADTDTFAGSDAQVAPELVQYITDADVSNAIDAFPYLVHDGDTSNATESLGAYDADTGSLSDTAVSVSPLDADSAEFSDAHMVGPDDTDTLTGADFGQEFALADADSAQAADTELYQPGRQVMGDDTFTGQDAAAPPPVTLADADTLSSGDTGASTASLQDADTAQADDEAALAAAVQDADSAAAQDAHLLGVVTSDAATAADSSSSTASTSDTDALSGTEQMGINHTFYLTASDAFHYDEAGAVTLAYVRDGDSASARDNGTWLPGSLGVVAEAFSIQRASVLGLPGTPQQGREIAQVTGVRSGTVALTVSAVSCLSDDTEIATWFEVSSAQVTIPAGYLSLPALDALGTPQSADGGEHAVAPWTMQLTQQDPLPVVLTCAARDHAGRPRSLQLVLYAVTLSWPSTGQLGYKSGMEVALSGRAVLSGADELGTPLPDPAFGRIASTPAVPAGALAGVYGG